MKKQLNFKRTHVKMRHKCYLKHFIPLSNILNIMIIIIDHRQNIQSKTKQREKDPSKATRAEKEQNHKSAEMMKQEQKEEHEQEKDIKLSICHQILRNAKAKRSTQKSQKIKHPSLDIKKHKG